jgi:hypothetical protein
VQGDYTAAFTLTSFALALLMVFRTNSSYDRRGCARAGAALCRQRTHYGDHALSLPPWSLPSSQMLCEPLWLSPVCWAQSKGLCKQLLMLLVAGGGRRGSSGAACSARRPTSSVRRGAAHLVAGAL